MSSPTSTLPRSGPRNSRRIVSAGAIVRRRLAHRKLARRHFLDFVTYTRPHYSPEWYHRLLAETLERFARGEIKRLAIIMPPRHGKSELTSRTLPAWIFGLNPEAEIIACSHTQALADKLSNQLQTVMGSAAYKAVFPKVTLPRGAPTTELRKRDVQTAKEFTIVQHRGSYSAAGVGGPIAGTGMTFGIIDDPVKNREQADSATMRNKVWDWYTSTFWTRQEGHASILVTSTRWHEDDLLGRLFKMARDGDGEHWHVLWLPMEQEAEIPRELQDNPGITLLGRERDTRAPGATLWPSKFPQDRLSKMKKTVGERDWASLYQGRPAAAEGNIIKRKYLHAAQRKGSEYFEVENGILIPVANCRRFDVVDLATTEETSSDYTAIASFYADPDTHRLFLVDLTNDRLTGGEHEPAIDNQRRRNSSNYTLVEKKFFGTELIQRMQRQRKPVMGVEFKGDKLARAYAACPFLERNLFYVLTTCPIQDVMIDQVLAFPRAPHDDIVDVLVYGVLHWDAQPIALAPTSLPDKDQRLDSDDERGRKFGQIRPRRPT